MFYIEYITVVYYNFVYYRSYGKQPTERGILQACPHGTKAGWKKEKMEAWDTGIARSTQLNEDNQPPHPENPIPLVCQSCQTRFVNCKVQYTYVFLVKQVKHIHIVIFC